MARTGALLGCFGCDSALSVSVAMSVSSSAAAANPPTPLPTATWAGSSTPALAAAAPASVSSVVPRSKYKLVFLGDESVGKTSLIARFMKDEFDTTYVVRPGGLIGVMSGQSIKLVANGCDSVTCQ